MSGGQFASKLRKQVIDLYNKHDTGKAFTSEQIMALIDISKCMCLVSLQEKVEKRHYDLYNQNVNWWTYRASLLGYSKTSLIDAMNKINKKYETTRISLLKLDACELI